MRRTRLSALSASTDHGKQVEAARYGLDGKMIDFGKQKEVAARDLIREYLDFVDDVVDELDSRQELNYVHEILERGTGRTVSCVCFSRLVI